MIKMFTVLIIMMSTGYGLQYMISANIRASLMLQTEVMAQSAMNQLKRYVIVEDNVAFMPYGLNGVGYHQLPDYFPVNRATRSGIPFLYCPYSSFPSLNLDATVNMSSTVSYSVDIVNTAITNNLDYVSGSTEPSVDGLIAAIVAPSYAMARPNCADIGLDANGRFMLTGASEELGKVYALTTFDIQGSTDSNTIILNDPSTQTITGALQDVALSPSENFTFVLPSGEDYTIDGDSDVTGANFGDRQLVVIRGFDAASPATLNSSVDVNLRFENVQVVLENVIFSQNVSLEFIDSDVLVRNVIVGPVSAESSDVIMDDVSIIGDARGFSALQLSLSTMRVRNGDLFVSSTHNPVVLIQESTFQIVRGNLNIALSDALIGIQVENSALIMRDSDLNYENTSLIAQALIYNDNSSRFYFESGNITGTGLLEYGVFTEGEATSKNSNYFLDGDVTIGFYAEEGSESTFNNTQIGSLSGRTITGLYDNGSDFIRGSLTTFALSCEGGYGFNRLVSAGFSDSVVSQVDPDFSIVVTEVNKIFEINLNNQFNKLTNSCL